MPIEHRIPPARHAQFNEESRNNWDRAKGGQWFVGVIDLDKNEASLAPVNVFGSSGDELDQSTLNNISRRGMNRYASGAPGEREGVSTEPEFLRNRDGFTRHTALAKYSGFNFRKGEGGCFGFTLIKYTNTHALFKGGSNSLNGDEGHSVASENTDYEGTTLQHSFSLETFPHASKMLLKKPILYSFKMLFKRVNGHLNPAGSKSSSIFQPTSTQLPRVWRDHIIESLQSTEARPVIPYIAASND